MRIHRLLLTICGLAMILAACGGGKSDDPTATPLVRPTATPEVTQVSTNIQGSTASDGICQITIPDDWVDDGTGRGVTATGDRWALFGGAIAGDAGWTSAKELLTSQMSDHEGADISDDGDRMTVVLADGRGYVLRVRFESRYCEFSVNANVDRPEDVTALWRNIAESLALVPAE